MTIIEYFEEPLLKRGFKKRSSNYYCKYHYGVKFISFNRLKSFDQYYLELGVLYDGVHSGFRVNNASSCPIHSELTMLEDMRNISKLNPEFSSNVDQIYLNSISESILNAIDNWFERWSEPRKVSKFIGHFMNGPRDTIVWSNALEFLETLA